MSYRVDGDDAGAAMSQSPATRARPLSPHLTVYRPPITMTMSIVHRITGGALYFGTLLVVWWVIAASVSERQFDIVSWVYGSWIGRLILFGYTWALLHHMLGGIRHLVWDTGRALEKHTASKLGWATLAGSIVLTVLIWIAGYTARGGL
jgi:succinate dehydrogenase / fumarate reductase cytochrome b subunit